jgi:hypothetical protein
MGAVGRSAGSRRSGKALSALLVSLSIAGCAGGGAVSGPEYLSENPEILVAMEEAIQDEYRAELIYLQVVDDFGPVLPFSNILYAEGRHSEAIARLYVARGLSVPASRWTPAEIPGFPSVSEACRAGVEAEIANAEIYERYFELDLPADVRQVFESNRAASLNNHLPAFERCS